MQANAEHLKRAAADSRANFDARTVSARGHNLFVDGLRGQAETPELEDELLGFHVTDEEVEGGVTDEELQSKDPSTGGALEARIAALEAAPAAPEPDPGLETRIAALEAAAAAP